MVRAKFYVIQAFLFLSSFTSRFSRKKKLASRFPLQVNPSNSEAIGLADRSGLAKGLRLGQGLENVGSLRIPHAYWFVFPVSGRSSYGRFPPSCLRSA